jgi:hypothetical protein
LRGLPVADNGISKWYPPEFLPRNDKGILFLDEIDMAPPAMQGVAQQLILDRRVGSYTVPDGWYVWAAGNRKEDRASVLTAHWRNALQQAAVVARTVNQGKLPAGMERELALLTSPQLDWRAYLWRYLVQIPTDFSGFDRRFIGRGLYL